MASPDGEGRRKNSLLLLDAVDAEKHTTQKPDNARISIPNFTSLAQSTIGSPPSSFSGPLSAYASSNTQNNASQPLPGFSSPADPSSRRSTRDDQDTLQSMPSLPSISEALKNAEVVPPPQAASTSQIPASPSGIQSFADAPRGPGNPFSQSLTPASTLRQSIPASDHSSIKPMPPPPAVPPDIRSNSPRINERDVASLGHASVSSNSHIDTPSFRTPFAADSNRPGYPFPDYYNTSQPNHAPPTSDTFKYEHNGKFKDSKLSFKPHPVPHSELIKRHLDIFDAELALSEMHTSSVQLLEFAKEANQRYHTANKQSYVNDALPHRAHIEEMIKVAQRTLHNLDRLRDAAVMQESALNEQRARAIRGPELDDDYQRIPDSFRSGDYGLDAKKRRGKAAPPGRCHSCNRAETPEWRRGPDGARTLCNACGLHYAKLTRKIGPNKAANMSGSNLRPKSLNDTRP